MTTKPLTHIGLIGGIGPAATAYYYQRIIRAQAASKHAFDLTIAHADVGELLRNMTNGASTQQAHVFLRLIQRLQAAGAGAVAITSIAGHFCIRELETLSPLPIISAVTALERELTHRGLRRVGLLGTRGAMESHLYGGLHGVEFVLPQGDSLETVHRDYVAMAGAGLATDEQRATMFSIGASLCQTQGAEAVVLAGTDLFLAFDGHECGFPVIDCAQVHIDAVVTALS